MRARKPLTQSELDNIREAAATGRYTIADLAFRFDITYQHAAKLCKRIKVPSKPIIRSYASRHTQAETVFEAIKRIGHDEDFEASVTDDFVPTSTLPGSSAKVEVLRRRVELGQPLWHRDDKNDYAGTTIGCKFAESLNLVHDTGPGIRVCKEPMSGGKSLG